MYCLNCKQNIPEGVNCCPFCGAPVQPMMNNSGNVYDQPQYYQINYDYDYNAVPEDFNLISAYFSMFKKYAKFKGRSRRKEYWLSWAMNMIINFILAIIMCVPIIPDAIATVATVLIFIYVAALFLPSLAMTVRRLHDTGKSGVFYLIAFFPFVGWLALLVLECIDGNPGPNRYGPDPKGRDIGQHKY